MNTKLTRENLKRHLTYHWWKYVVAAVLGWFVVDILFTVTAYRSPEDKKVEVYVYGMLNEEGLNGYMEEVRKEILPDMEVASSQNILSDDTYGDMVLQVRMMAHEGDIYILPKESFLSYCSVGYFVPLDRDEELMKLLDEKKLNTQSGWRIVRDEETGATDGSHLYGIPVSQLPSLMQYAYAEDGYVCVSVVSGNEENVMKFLKRFVADMAEPLPEPEETQTEPNS